MNESKPREPFEQWFLRATGDPPHRYQRDLAEAPDWPDVLDAPTGSGKTAVVLLWLWRRLHFPAVTPRRLVYCLPRRTLVEQTFERVHTWLDRLDVRARLPGEPGHIHVQTVMGGQASGRGQGRIHPWWHYPESQTVLIGTQDMLLSRALNRGYASPRPVWPAEFGLLHSDALWVCDEVQLMDEGLGTTAQLAGLRGAIGHYGRAPTLWMSATVDHEALRTVDHQSPCRVLRLWDSDPASRDDDLARRLRAHKVLTSSVLSAGSPDSLATAILKEHRPATLTLVILNRVERARHLHAALEKACGKQGGRPECLLFHGRFRPYDRRGWVAALGRPLDGPGRIIVATQVVEAGVDADARTLWTEVAPWSSLVQRFGRCNRAGMVAAEDPARIFWLDVGDDEKDAAPYAPSDLALSRVRLSGLEAASVGPEALRGVELPPVVADGNLLRRPDLVGLFDTSPDLSGNDLDVSRFVRDAVDADVYVFWRTFAGAQPEDSVHAGADELCPVPIPAFRDFLGKAAHGLWPWRYDHLERRWTPASPADIRPGRILLLASAAGGYTPATGWTGIPGNGPVAPVPSDVDADADEDNEEDLGGNAESQNCQESQSIDAHTDRVVAALQRILPDLADVLPGGFEVEGLRCAARYHDAGKAHPVFQETMRSAGCPPDPDSLWAKAPRRGVRHARKHFRHELASLVLFLHVRGWVDDRTTNLAAYLIAAHHGKVRMTIRAFPDEREPGRPAEELHALGVWNTDHVPERGQQIDLGGGVVIAAQECLDLGLIRIGLDATDRPSWLDRTVRLRDAQDLGPFRLAYLESVLRAADARADEAGGR